MLLHATGPGQGISLLLTIALLLPAAGYLLAAEKYRARRDWSEWRSISFVGGLALLALALHAHALPPAGDFPRHMMQHVLIGMLAPLGLALGRPLTLALATLPPRGRKALAATLRRQPVELLGHPVAAATLTAGGMFLLYATPLYAATLTNPALHAAVHAHFLLAGFVFASSIGGLHPSRLRPSFQTKLAVLVLAAAAHSTLAKLMYARGWPAGTPHDLGELQAGAQVMYYGGDLAELLLATVLFLSWYQSRSHPAVSNEGTGQVLSS